MAVRPTIDLHRNDDAPLRLPLDPGVGHLLMVLLNNAADAGEKAGRPRVDLDLRIEGDDLIGEVRDYGHGFDARAAVLPGKLFGSSKSEGMGVGLALSHATIERLDGDVDAPGPGGRQPRASACRWPHARTPHEPSPFHPGPAGRRRRAVPAYPAAQPRPQGA
jgi:two-component system sensor histidine kinase RegB